MTGNHCRHDAEAQIVPSPARQRLAHAIGLATAVGALYTLWMIVPFFQGRAASPLVTTWNYLAPVRLQLSGSLDVVREGGFAGVWLWFLHYWLGVMGYVAAAGAIVATGGQIERILQVGWAQYQSERQAAIEADARDARIEAARERRRAQRLASARAGSAKQDGTAVALVVGAVVAVWLFWM